MLFFLLVYEIILVTMFFFLLFFFIILNKTTSYKNKMSFPSESDMVSKELQNSDLIYVNLMTDVFKIIVKYRRKIIVWYFFLTAIWLPHGQLWAIIGGDSLTHPMLITAFLHFRPEGHRYPLERNSPRSWKANLLLNNISIVLFNTSWDLVGKWFTVGEKPESEWKIVT